LKLDAVDPLSGERSARLARHYEEAIAKRRLEREKKSLRGRLTRRLERLERRIEHIEEDLERADKADEYRRRGELLQSAWGEVEPGAESVTVPDFYDESMPRVEIPLDPSASLQENIEQYFHEYQRLSSASEEIEERLAESKALRERVEEAIAEFDNLGDDIEQIEAFAQRLEDEGVLREEQPQRSGSSRDETPRKAYREFRSGRDRPILVGRGASDNDTLTTSVARGRDIWLHARDWPGAHVILRMRKDQNAPTSQDLVDAATLAAWFSDGRKDTLVDITYTRAKHVRKPKGFPPGKVTVADASTIAVAVEEERLERLLESERRD
ncbi:MAG: NFACT RNA binding domain-containing protein, partial [Persicimonas sp.]